MADTSEKIVLARLPRSAAFSFDLAPEAPARAALATEFGLLALRKLRFAGSLVAEGKRDWALKATLGATVVQPCVVTAEPVTTRIDDPVTRRFLANMPQPEGDEAEIPDDDTLEPLPEILDLATLMAEALALALPLYPRAPGAAPARRYAGRPDRSPARRARAAARRARRQRGQTPNPTLCLEI